MRRCSDVIQLPNSPPLIPTWTFAALSCPANVPVIGLQISRTVRFAFGLHGGGPQPELIDLSLADLSVTGHKDSCSGLAGNNSPWPPAEPRFRLTPPVPTWSHSFRLFPYISE